MAFSSLTSNITKSSNSIEMSQGESRDLDLWVVNEVTNIDGVSYDEPVDLTGATVYFSVRRKTESPHVLIRKYSGDVLAIEMIAPSSCGMAVIHLFSDDTKHMRPGEYVFDVWVLFSTGKQVPVIEPTEFIIKGAVTRLP